ncbi:hypothetical protein JXA47_06850 [Candidatus Sumerlaeota bacterium]|nr:hypothetical protein [Candidatus Sumerlaeota bacterium]
MRQTPVAMTLAMALLGSAAAMVPISLGNTLIEGQLTPSDTESLFPHLGERMGPSFFRDIYSFQGNGGQMVIVTLSADFDCYLMLVDSGGNLIGQNDDWTDISTSQVNLALPHTGTQHIIVTSFSPGQTGRYTLTATGGGSGQTPSAPSLPSITGRVIEGDLTRGDTAPLPNTFNRADPAYLRDAHPLQGQAGSTVTLDLAADFDCYLFLLAPDGQVVGASDDFQGANHSRIVDAPLTQTGTHLVVVTSYGQGTTGHYTLTIGNPQQGMPVTPDQVISVGQTIRGQLQAGDSAVLPSGVEQVALGFHRDGFQLNAPTNIPLTIDLECDFDGYLHLVDPRGVIIASNDDHGDTRHAQIQTQLTQLGPHRIVVTSYGQGMMGNYTLSVSQSGSGQPGQGPPGQGSSPDMPLAIGQSVQGSLVTGDSAFLRGGGARIGGDYLRDGYVLDAPEGMTLVIDMESDFDGYLFLVEPSGNVLAQNDDHGSTLRSRIEATLRQSGPHRIVVTSFAAQTQGNYRLSFSTPGGQTPSPTPAPSGGDLPLAIGGVASGQLTASDTAHHPISQHQFGQPQYPRVGYVFQGSAGQSIQITLHASFGGYLFLLDPVGALLAEGPGEPGDVQVTATLSQSGPHRILVTTTDPADLGEYSLSVSPAP